MREWNPHIPSFKVLLAVLMCVLVSRVSVARLDLVPGSRYTAARGAAMGDAYLPVADDTVGGLFYNPAALGRMAQTHFEPFNLSFLGNLGYFGSTSLTSFFKAFSLSSIEPTLKANPLTTVGGGVAFAPTIYLGGIGAGALFSAETFGKHDGLGNLTYKSKYILAPAVGGSLRLAKGIMRLGYVLQWVNQASAERTILDDASPMGYNQSVQLGSGLSHNVGFALTWPYQMLPALNIVARNIAGLKFSGTSLMSFHAKNPVGTPDDEPMSIDASFSLTPKTGSGTDFAFVFQGRDLTNTSGMSLLGRLSLGGELSLRDKMFLRVGFGSGYPSAGLGLNGKNSELSLTWYAEEFGDGYQKERDTRVMFQFKVRAF